LAEYLFQSDAPSDAHAYLWPCLQTVIAHREWNDRRGFDLGCGNGATAAMFAKLGWDVTGVDISQSGIAIARKSGIKAEVADAYDDLKSRYGTFPLVISLEVIQHCFDPDAFVRTFLSLIAPGGLGVLSTTYHGYAKNVALAVSGRLDLHFRARWTGGPIKFFSEKSLSDVLHRNGAKEFSIRRVGRWPKAFAKSMVAVIPSSPWNPLPARR
jgi:2-polyprenyl-3-methyl-5-hydroxy-6-metoxy-1,4-benzoquinol methylase